MALRLVMLPSQGQPGKHIWSLDSPEAKGLFPGPSAYIHSACLLIPKAQRPLALLAVHWAQQPPSRAHEHKSALSKGDTSKRREETPVPIL